MSTVVVPEKAFYVLIAQYELIDLRLQANGVRDLARMARLPIDETVVAEIKAELEEMGLAANQTLVYAN